MSDLQRRMSALFSLVATASVAGGACASRTSQHATAPAAATAPVATETSTRPVAPTPEVAVVETDVTFSAGTRVIHGTLSRPSDAARHPALLVIAGSGPTDRNWEGPLLAGANGSARLLGPELARRGIVMLRYDKLGTGQTAAPTTPTSWNDYVAEQRAALDFLRAQSSVDTAHVFLGGHSEGGAHAIHLLEQPGVVANVRGLVLLSSMSRSMRDTVIGQIEPQFARSGLPAAQVATYMQQFRQGLDDLIAGRPVNPARVTDLPPIQQLFAAFAAPGGLPFSREILPFDAAEHGRALRVPMLVINGGRDIQVSPDRDARRLADTARAGGNADVTLFIAPNADHVLKFEETPLDRLDPMQVQRGYAGPGRHLDPDVVSTLSRWIVDHSR